MNIKLYNIGVEIVQKDIKNVHLSVYPPKGRVKVSAPENMSVETIRVFVISKLGWIKKQQNKISTQKRETSREYIDRESHYFFGKRYLLKVAENKAPPVVKLNHNTLELIVRPGTPAIKRQAILYEWYRAQMKLVLPDIIKKHEKLMGVKVGEFGIKRMKTKWGTCNPVAKRIWLNLELAKKPVECLEYIVVHEMTHLLEPGHNNRFISLMDGYMPKWRFYKDELNRLPISHCEWGY
ncbi:MAG: SprT family zinc-dependent metalloprotease [Proteobacteria bacterium]|nr:SprT family zinc-dependent metalloprotease [Pseudomonadota bacterium]